MRASRGRFGLAFLHSSEPPARVVLRRCAMQFRKVSEEGKVVYLACSGTISQGALEFGQDPLRDLLGEHYHSRILIIDFEHATFIDSSGIGWLIVAHKGCVQAGGKLILHSIPPVVNQVFQMLKLHMILGLHPDLAAAKRAIPESAKSEGGPH